MSTLPIQQEGVTSLQWVLVEEKLHHVSEFAELPSHQRPAAICPVCREPVRMKLGKVLIHHCAHMAGSTCAASVGETAVHLNTKLHIYDQLLKTDKLSISRKCITCSNTHETVWIRNWDEVHIEYTVGTRRPDIALLKEGKILGAIEICVSHPIDPDKADFFKSKEIRWIEVGGSPSLYSSLDGWTVRKALSIRQIGPEIKDWTCKTCLDKIPKDVEDRIRLRHEQLRAENKLYWARRAKEIAEEQERNNGSKRKFGRFMDFYYPNQTWECKVIYQVVELADGNCVGTRIETSQGEILVAAIGCTTSDLIKQFNHYISRLRHQGVQVDSPMTWIAIEQFNHLTCREEPRLIWSDTHQQWKLPKAKEDHKWAFRH